MSTSNQVIPKISCNERDFDRLFIEELCFGEGFFEAFADRIGFRPRPIKVIRHSVFENFGGFAWGETDIFVELVDGAALLIENKLSADFQPEQAERYRARADYHRKAGSEVQTILIAPFVYLGTVPEGDWDKMCSYAELADCILTQDARSIWRKSMLRAAGNRAARVQNLAKSAAARKVASAELLTFKAAWLEIINKGTDWKANPQFGATDEFLYAPRINPFGLRIWHHPFSGYLSVQNVEKFPNLDNAVFRESLPEGFRVARHPRSTYLDASVPEIDMSAEFSEEWERVDEGMKVARHALDVVEAAIRQLPLTG